MNEALLLVIEKGPLPFQLDPPAIAGSGQYRDRIGRFLNRSDDHDKGQGQQNHHGGHSNQEDEQS